LGGGSYEDALLAGVGGVDRLDKLPFDGWGRNTEHSELYQGLPADRTPGGTVSFDLWGRLPDNWAQWNPNTVPGDPNAPKFIDVDNMRFINAMFEDGRANQHLYGNNPHIDPATGKDLNAVQWGEIILGANLNPGTHISAISMSGFPEGAQIEIRDANGNVLQHIDVTSPNQVVNFPPNAFEDTSGIGTPSGVFVLPPPDSDGDMHLNTNVTLSNQFGSVTVHPPLVIAVDAVADKPDIGVDVQFTTDYTTYTTHVSEENRTQTVEHGWAKDSLDKHDEVQIITTPGDSLTATLHITLTFGDFLDNSEKHYGLVEIPSAANAVDKNGNPYQGEFGDWTIDPDSFPQGMIVEGSEMVKVTIWYDAQGNVVGEGAQAPAGGVESKDFFRFEVNNDYLANHMDQPGVPGSQATVELDLTLTNNAGIRDDVTFELTAGAQAVDSPSDGELTLSNNVSYTWNTDNGGVTSSLVVDVVDSTLQIRVGWASEGNNDAKHLAGGQADSALYEADYQGIGVSERSTLDDHKANLGAPIELRLSGDNAGEHIESATLSFASDRGVLMYLDENGQAQPYPSTAINVDGFDTYTVIPDASGNLPTLFFQPNPGFDYSDVTMTYDVTVQNTAGHTAVYHGDTVVVIDAVADKPTFESHSVTFANDVSLGGAHDAVRPNDEVKFEFKLNFPDNSGGETHYVYVENFLDKYADIDPNTFSLTINGVPYSAEQLQSMLVDNVGGAGYFKIPVDNGVNDFDVVLTVQSTKADGSAHYEINYGASAQVAGEDGGGAAGSLDGGREYDTANNYSATGTSDFIAKFGPGSKQDPTNPLDPDKPYDPNDPTGTPDPHDPPADPLTFTVDPVNCSLSVVIHGTYEGDVANQHGAAPGDPNWVTAPENAGVISFSLAGNAAGDNEYISSIYLKFTDGGQGTVTFHGVDITDEVFSGDGILLHFDPVTGLCTNPEFAGHDVSYTDLASDLKYTPNLSSDADADLKIDYAVSIRDPDSGDILIASNMADNAAKAALEADGAAARTVLTDGQDNNAFAGGELHTLVVDAVADQGSISSEQEPKALYGGDEAHTAAVAGAVVDVHGAIQFHDTDGSELHYLRISIGDDPNSGFSLGGLSFLKGDAIMDHWRDVGNMPAAGGTTADAQGLDYGMNQAIGNPDGACFLLIEVNQNTGDILLYANVNGLMTAYNLNNPAAENYLHIDGLDIHYDFNTGLLEYNLPVTTPAGATADVSIGVGIAGVSVEQVAPASSGLDSEYANNIAVVEANDGKPIPIEVDVITGRLVPDDGKDHGNYDPKSPNDPFDPNKPGDPSNPDSPNYDPRLDPDSPQFDPEFKYDPNAPGTGDFGLRYLYEDGQPKQWTDADGNRIVTTGETDTTLQRNWIVDTTDPEHPVQLGVQVFREFVATDGHTPTYLYGASPSEYVKEISFDSLPDPKVGELLYDGQPIVAGQVYEDPDMSKFTFLPGEDWSGDLNFSYDSTIASHSSGATVTPDTDTGYIHVESVADLADAHLGDKLAQTVDEQGNILVAADPGAADGQGWFVSAADKDTAVQATVHMSFTLHDLDGSETATILIPAAGVKLLENWQGEAPETVTINGVDYYVFAKAEASVLQDWIDGKGGGCDVKLVVDSANPGTLNLYVVTQETGNTAAGDPSPGISTLNQTGNDVAVREVGSTIDLAWLSESVTLKVGWVYEGGDATKHIAGGDYTSNDANLSTVEGANTSQYLSAQQITSNAAPVVLEFSKPEEVQQVTFTYDSKQGTLYFDGVALGAPDANGMVTVTITKVGDLSNMTFVPSADYKYGDADIALKYTVTIKEGDNTFLVSGETTVAVDAVADRTLVEHTSAGAADDNASVHLTVTANFHDRDGSENHYILVEKKDGWTAEYDPHYVGEHTVFYDKDGNTLNYVWDRAANDGAGEWTAPAGFTQDPVTGEWTVPDGCKVETFWQFDVSDRSYDANGAILDANGVPVKDFDVLLTPVGTAHDTDFDTGTLVVEKVADPTVEYDYGNNMAYDIVKDGASVNVVDAALKWNPMQAFEDNKSIQDNLENYPLLSSKPDDSASGFITLKVDERADGTPSHEVVNTSPDAEASVTLSFEWHGDASVTDLSTAFFTIPGGDGTEYKITWTQGVDADGQNCWTGSVSISSSDFAPGASVTVQYHPPLNDDTDLKNIEVSVPVISPDTGLTGVLEGNLGTMVVDAVADAPVNVGVGAIRIDAGGEGSEHPTGYDKADWGSTVEIPVSATFFDYKDGSETHYLLVQKLDGWDCGNADGTVQVGGVTYWYVAVSNDALQATTDGSAAYTFKLTAPDSSSGDSTIANDGTVTFKTGGLAVEGLIQGPAEDSTTGLSTIKTDTQTDGESNYLNNVALATENAKVSFNVLNDSDTGKGYAYEDNRPDLNVDNATVDPNSGKIVIDLHDPNNQETINSGELTFTYNDGHGGTPGDFTYVNSANETVTLHVGDNGYTNNGDGTYTITLPPDLQGLGASGQVELQYHPPLNDSTDLTNFGYRLDVSANDSKAAGEISGMVTTDGHTAGTFVVDAVADKPVDLVLPDNDGITYSYNGGDEHSAAAPGGTVTIPVSVGFGDYLDGSEKHYIVIQKVDGWDAHGNDGTVVVTGTAADGITYYKFDVSDAIDAAVGKVTSGDFTGLGQSTGVDPVTGETLTFYTYHDSTSGAVVTLTVNQDGSLADTVKVSLDVTLDVPANAGHDLTFQAGGVADEGRGLDDELRSPDINLSDHNNMAVTTEPVKVLVDPIESTPSLVVDANNNHIYENLKPNQHHEDGAFGGKPVYGPDGTTLAEDNVPAVLDFSGMQSGETADVTLYFAATEQTGPTDFSQGYVLVRDAGGNYLTDEATGDPIKFALTPEPDANGAYHTVDPLHLTGDSTIEFYPGENNSNRDITVTYDVTVTDSQSGAQHTWTTSPPPLDADPHTDYGQAPAGTIYVDSVAQAPAVGVELKTFGDETGGYFPNGSDITLNAELKYPDWEDKSEIHYILVDASQIGFVATQVVIQAPDGDWVLARVGNSETWTITSPDGTKQTFDGYEPWQVVGPDGAPQQYYRFEVPQEIMTACGGDLKITVTVDTPDDVSGTLTLRVGGMSHEDPNILNTELRDGSDQEQLRAGDTTNPAPGELDDPRANNISIKVEDTNIYFEGPGAIGISMANPKVYEGDIKDANVGGTTPEGGAPFSVVLPYDPDGTHYTVENITFSVPRGTIYYEENGTLVPLDISHSYTRAEIESLGQLRYVADNTNDKDVDIKISADITNNHTGQESLGVSGDVHVLVDAVAQQPILHDDTATAACITVSFPDNDGSEQHYILIEAKPGATLMVDGVAVPRDVFYHQNEDGTFTAYYKVPVELAQDNHDGSYTLDYTYQGGGVFHYGAMAVESQVTDGEITYHNNVAIAESQVTLGADGGGGGTGAPIWHPGGGGGSGGGGHDPVYAEVDVLKPAYENGTPNANIGDLSYTGDAELQFQYVYYTRDSAPGPNGEPGYYLTPHEAAPTEVSITFDSTTCGLRYGDDFILTNDPGGKWTVELGTDGKTVTVTFHDLDSALQVDLRPGNYIDAYTTGELNSDLSVYHNNDDTDLHYSWSMTLPNGDVLTSDTDGRAEAAKVDPNVETREYTVMVDAVAQGVVDGSLGYNDGGHVFGEVDGHNQTQVTLTGQIVDTDGSENCCFLIEASPGLNVEGATTVYIDGMMYYKVQVPADSVDSSGHASVTVTLITDRGALETSALDRTEHRDDEGRLDTTDFQIHYGAMTEETFEEFFTPGMRDGEITFTNNVSVDTSGTATITVSYVTGTVSVDIHNTYENNEWGNDSTNQGQIVVHVEQLDANDVLDQFSITFKPAQGEIVFHGENGVTYSLNGDAAHNFDALFGEGGWSISYNGDQATLVLSPGAEPLDPSLLQGMAFSTAGNYSSTDASVSWAAVVRDTASLDTQTFTGTQTIIIDAVAQAPGVSDVHLESGLDGAWTAAASGGQAEVAMTLHFEDVGTGELHYAVMANDGVWICDKILVTDASGTDHEVTPKLIYDQAGNPYYAAVIDDAWLDNGSANVRFEVSAPNPGKDADYQVKLGGISVESFTQPDGELTLSNNWTESIEKYTLSIGVAETKTVDFGFATLVEDDAHGAAITLSGATLAALQQNHEVVTDTTLTFTAAIPAGQSGFTAGEVIGTVNYNGTAYEITATDATHGTVTVSFGSGGFDPAGDFSVVWGHVDPVSGDFVSNHTGAAMTVTAESTVQDIRSGEEGAATGGGSVAWQATADAATDIHVDATTKDAYGAGATVQFQASAKFVDVDGSEQHYILVEAKPGWGGYTTVTIDGVDYFQVPVTSTSANPTVTVTLTTPSGLTADETINLTVGARVVDGSSVANTFAGDSVDVQIGVVQATGVSLSMAGMLEDGDPTPLLFSLAGGHNDSISSITISDLAGGSLVGPGGTVITSARTFTGADLQALLDGDYSYKPGDNQSGAKTIGFSAVVQDDDSGATKSFANQTGTVNITPVTDTPIDLHGSAGDAAQIAGHAATVAVSLSANFQDYTGSEVHFFLVQLPEGIPVPAGWTAVSDPAILGGCGLAGPVYYVAANAAGQGGFTITVPENYAGSDLHYVAGSYEATGILPQDYQYEFSTPLNPVSIDATGAYNYGPQAGDGSGTVDALRHADVAATGTISMTDRDGDTVTVSGAHCGNTPGMPVEVDGLVVSYQVPGEYGILTIDAATGAYSYALNVGANPPDGFKEEFSITVTDGRAEAGSTITINVSAINHDPTADDPHLVMGGVNEAQFQTDMTGQVALHDTDGDTVTLTGVTGGVWDDAHQNWTVVGQYGTLVIDAQGGYTYTLSEESAKGQTTGAESFTFSFHDPYGGTGSQTLSVNLGYVNHAPEIADQQAHFDGTASYISGAIAFSDPDSTAAGSHQGDTASIAYVIFGGVTYPVGAQYTAIETQWGTLNVKADGSYIFNANSGADTADVWENFTIGVKDSHGLVSEGAFDLAIGNPSDPLSMMASPVALSLNLNPDACHLELTTGDPDPKTGATSFDLHLRNSVDDTGMIAAAAITVTFTVHCDDPGFDPASWIQELPTGSSVAVTPPTDDSGNYTLVATLAPGTDSLHLGDMTPDGRITTSTGEHTLSLTLDHVETTVPGLDATQITIGNDTLTVHGGHLELTFDDADYAMVAQHGVTLGEAVGKEVVQLTPGDGEMAGMHVGAEHTDGQIIIGTDGHDIIYASQGNDILVGGAGPDTYVWHNGNMGQDDNALDIIKNFTKEDTLRFDDLFADQQHAPENALENLLQHATWTANAQGTGGTFLATATDEHGNTTTSIQLSFTADTPSAMLTVSYHHDGTDYSQKVELQGFDSSQFHDAGGTIDQAAVAEMLKEIIQTGGGH